MVNKIISKVINKKGQAALEYGLLLTFISLPLIVGVNSLLGKLVTLIQTASSYIGVGLGKF